MAKKIVVMYDVNPIIQDAKSGVGYYAEGLLKALSRNNNLELHGYYFNFLKQHTGSMPKVRGLIEHENIIVPGRLLTVLRKIGLQLFLETIVNKKSDVTIFTNYVILPMIRKTKKILVVYDLCFIDNPEFVQEKNLRFLKKYSPSSINKADLIITISEFTKNRLEFHFPLTKGKIIVTPIPPVTELIRKTSLNHRLIKLNIIKNKYILYLGTVEPRKNILSLLDAYQVLPKDIQKKYSLVIAGGKGWKDQQILDKIHALQAAGLNVIQTGYISDDEKAALYSNAAMFVLPSHYEGFGMPILEAMQYGLPVAVSDIPVFHEVARDAAIYFKQNNYKDIALKITKMLNDRQLTSSMIVKGYDNLHRFSWENNAVAVYDVIEELVAN